MIHAFTSSAPNYLSKVRVLCQSLREHCPDFVIHWLVADVYNEALLQTFQDDSVDHILFVDDLAACSDPGWLFRHELVELSTATKPAAALSLLSRDDCDLLLYFDPDTVLFSGIEDLIAELRSASVVLTPHLLGPESELGAVLDHELCSLRHGVFNLGFFGVRDCEDGKAFLQWWRDRCYAFCWNDWRSGAFTDQKWVNFAPVFFPSTSILRSPRFNVAPWNINQRSLEGSFDESFSVEGEPLGFYHFSGFDSGAHQQVVEKYAEGNRSVFSLLQWYAERTRYLSPPDAIPWLLGVYENGECIAREHRQIYRESEDLQRAFRNPYLAPSDQGCFRDWLRTSDPKEYPQVVGSA